MRAPAPQITISEATRVYAIYCREDRPSINAIAIEVYGEDNGTNRNKVHARLHEARRKLASAEVI